VKKNEFQNEMKKKNVGHLWGKVAIFTHVVVKCGEFLI